MFYNYALSYIYIYYVYNFYSLYFTYAARTKYYESELV